jgi:dihydroflavonol-4-reductase
MIENKLIAITGGSGHLGTCLIQMLLKKGDSVKALYRSTIPAIEHSNLTWIKGDIRDLVSVKELIEGSSVLIHGASLISIDGKNKDEVYNINVNGTEKIIESCLHKKINLIYISSSSAVLETKPDQVFNEDRPYKTENDFVYAWTKAVAEQMVLNSVKENNLNAFIIRPTAIVGPPDLKPSHFGQAILDLARSKINFTTSGGYNIVDVRDLSQTIINSIVKGEQGEVYLVGGTYFSLNQIAKLVNPDRKLICLPLGFLIGILPIINMYKKIFSLKWQITRVSLFTLKNAPRKVDMSKAVEKLDHEIRPVTETINDLILWFRNQDNK